MDSKIFSQKVLELEKTLYHISKTILKNDADCEDAVQEAILNAYLKIDTLRNEQYFKTWLIRILINECYKSSRKIKKYVVYEEYLKEKSEVISDNYENDVYLAINKLDIKFRMVIVLFYVEGYSIDEICQILKIPKGTVKSRLSRGRKKLEKIINMEEVYYEYEECFSRRS